MKKITIIIVLCVFTAMIANAQHSGKSDFKASDLQNLNYSVTGHEIGSRTTDCDTLRYPLTGEIIYYYMLPPGIGYITGNNSYKDKAKAEFFNSFEIGTTINGMIADFVVAKSASNPQITFAIWNSSATDGKPGTIVATATKSLNSIVGDVNNEQATSVTFDQPFTVTGPFYAGIILPTGPGDTLALWCRKHVAGYNGTAWEQWDNNAWYPFNHPDSWGDNMQTTMTIFPIVCQPLGIDDLQANMTFATPVPATGIVNINAWKTSGKHMIDVYSLTGKTVYSKSFPGSIANFNIDLSTLPKGIYILKLNDGQQQKSQKLILE